DRAMRVETIILTGVIFSAFLGALISLMIALTGDELRQIIGWLLGSVSMRRWEHVQIILPFFAIGSILLLLHVKELNAMSLDRKSVVEGEGGGCGGCRIRGGGERGTRVRWHTRMWL